jgi:hydroxyacylglutathione hydrolase/adenylyltransferase/sulfurtransferase
MTVGSEDSIEIGPERAAELLREGDVQLVDVREGHEVQQGRLAGSRHIALGELAVQASTLDQDRPVLFYCRVGGRSAMAATAFRQAGFEAYSLAGGLVAWHGQGRPLEPADGRVAGH